MPSPFPGMDPYLEAAGLWPLFQQTIVACLREVHGLALVTWPLAFRPMHDALIEDSLACAEASLGLPPAVHHWSPWVKVLRWIISRGKARKQITPNKRLQPTQNAGGVLRG
jgi:hypothetical protein